MAGSAIPLQIGGAYFLEKYRVNRALKQKRKALGLEGKVEKPEMREFAHFGIDPNDKEALKRVLENAGLKKKKLRGRFIGEDVKVRYKSFFSPERVLSFVTNVSISANNPESAGPIYREIVRNIPITTEYEIHPELREQETGEIPEPQTPIPGRGIKESEIFNK